MLLSIVSPTFNEAGNIESLMQRLESALNGIDFELVIVDDNSPDMTWRVAEDLARMNRRVRVIRRIENRGLGFAVIDGFSAARGDIVACMDADLQHDPKILPQMLNELGKGVDVVVGSRYVAGGALSDWNPLRRMGSRVATKLARAFLGVRLEDPMSGFFLMRRSDFLTTRDRLDGNGFKILLEILADSGPDNLKSVKEVPYVFGVRTVGKSKLSKKIVFQYLKQLLRLYKRRLRRDFRLSPVGSSERPGMSTKSNGLAPRAAYVDEAADRAPLSRWE